MFAFVKMIDCCGCCYSFQSKSWRCFNETNGQMWVTYAFIVVSTLASLYCNIFQIELCDMFRMWVRMCARLLVSVATLQSFRCEKFTYPPMMVDQIVCANVHRRWALSMKHEKLIRLRMHRSKRTGRFFFSKLSEIDLCMTVRVQACVRACVCVYVYNCTRMQTYKMRRM